MTCATQSCPGHHWCLKLQSHLIHYLCSPTPCFIPRELWTVFYCPKGSVPVLFYIRSIILRQQAYFETPCSFRRSHTSQEWVAFFKKYSGLIIETVKEQVIGEFPLVWCRIGSIFMSLLDKCSEKSMFVFPQFPPSSEWWHLHTDDTERRCVTALSLGNCSLVWSILSSLRNSRHAREQRRKANSPPFPKETE